MADEQNPPPEPEEELEEDLLDEEEWDEDEDDEESPELFRWDVSVTPPWDPGTYFLFLMPEDELYAATPVGYTPEFAQNFHTAMSHFLTGGNYAGLHRTIERLAAKFTQEGEDEGVSLLMSSIAAQLVREGVADFLPDFTHARIYHTAESAEETEEPLTYPTSPLHAWSFLQACEYLEQDILPTFENETGQDSYPFGDLPEIRQAIQQTQAVLAPEVQKLMGNINPYRQIADVRTIGLLSSEEENETELK